MNNIYLDLIKNEIHVKDPKKLITLINQLVIDNKNIMNSIPPSIRSTFGDDLYLIRQINLNDFKGLNLNPMFSKFEYEKEIIKLIFMLKNLLSIHINLLVHKNIITQREKEELDFKLKNTNGFKVYQQPFKIYKSQQEYTNFINDLNNTLTINDLYNEIIQALKNVAYNSEYFGLEFPLAYDTINLDKLKIAQKFIVNSTSKYDTEKKELLDFINELLIKISQLIFVDGKKFNNSLLKYDPNIINSIINFDQNTILFNIFKYENISIFIKNLQNNLLSFKLSCVDHFDLINLKLYNFEYNFKG